MIVSLLLVAAIVQANAPIYSSEYVRLVVRDAAKENRRVPATLEGYRASAEVEVALLRQDATGSERALRVEQIAERTSWRRDGTYAERVVGHRAVSSGLRFTTALKARSLTIPVLYGNRFDLLLGPYGLVRSADGTERRITQEVHPLADDRESVYRFSGGETVQRLEVGGRVLPVVRIVVDPVNTLRQYTTVFRGELYLDSLRRRLVGMRGQVLEIGGAPSWRQRIADHAVRRIGFLEVLSMELNGAYWIPVHQRIEMRLQSPLIRGEELVLRLTATLGDVLIHENAAMLDATAATEAPHAYARKLALAPRDSLSRFPKWTRELGQAAATTDFDDLVATLASESRANRSRPSLEIVVASLSDLFHFNRVEGAYTGFGLAASSPGSASETSLRLSAGYAWSEERWRGEVNLERRASTAAIGAALFQRLDQTNDFTLPGERGSPLSALVGRDDYDYVSREGAAVYAERRWEKAEAKVRLEIGIARDRGVKGSRRHGLWRADSVFRTNRPVSAGDYTRAMFAFEFHPAVLAEYVRPGAGFSVALEHGTGGLSYTRVAGRVSLRQTFGGAILLGARMDGGALLSRKEYPLQQLFEIGGPVQLPGFQYKEFAGDRAALGQLSVIYAPGFLTPVLPLAPRLSARLSVAQISTSSPRARDAVRLLGTSILDCGSANSCTYSSGRQTSVSVGIRVLDGGVFVGLGRRISNRDGWKGVLSFGFVL